MIERADPPIRRIYYWRWTCPTCGKSGHAETHRAAYRNRNDHWRRCPDPARLQGAIPS